MEAQLHVIRESLDAPDEEIAEAIREYCLSQVDIWREIPFWAWHASGRNVWNLHAEVWWGIMFVYEGTTSDHLNVMLDLETGELSTTPLDETPFIDATPEYQISLLARQNELEKIDAPAVLAHLKRLAHMPIRFKRTLTESNPYLWLDQYKLEEWFGPISPRPYVHPTINWRTGEPLLVEQPR